MEKYLLNLDWDLFEDIDGIYVTKHHIKGWRYFSTYDNGKAKKQAIFNKLAKEGMIENQSEWSWHHVVEGNHIKPLVKSGDYEELYHKKWITVLMHTPEEHKILTDFFRTSGTLQGIAKGSTLLRGNDRITFINSLDQRYKYMYAGDPVLQKVAQNVFQQFRIAAVLT